MLDEARESFTAAIGGALAVENHFPLPDDAAQALSRPILPLWGAAVSDLRHFLEPPDAAWTNAEKALTALLTPSPAP